MILALTVILDTDMGQDIIGRLIPLIDYLRRRIPLTMSTMFSRSLLKDLGLTGDIDCGNLDDSDKFFDSIRRK